jgi:hypothetical protein
MRKKLLGTLIGFASGLYVTSALSTTVFYGKSFATDLDKWGLIFVYFIIITGFCFFGVYCMSDKGDSINRE